MADYLYLVRHGSVGPAHSGRYLGSTDLPLDDAGRKEAQALAKTLRARRGCRRCVSSPMVRATQTAEIVAGGTNLARETDPDLREIDFGQWEGKTFDEISISNPCEVERWAQFTPDFAFPGGESLEGFLARIHRAADRLAADPAEAVLAVTHGGVIRFMLCHLLGLAPRQYIALDIAPGSLTVVRLFDGKGVLWEMIRGRPKERQ